MDVTVQKKSQYESSDLANCLEERLAGLDQSRLSELLNGDKEKTNSAFWDWHDKSGDDDWTKVSWEKVG